MKEDRIIIENEAKKELEKGKNEAKELLKDPERMELFLQKLEKKLKTVPKLGETLAIVPTMISLIRNYIKKEYVDIPLGTIIAIISALIYFLSPIDIVPDNIPGFGHIDDAAVIAACLKWVGDDIKEYENWREKNNKKLV